ncbi:terpenoid cyclases/protein prenyltransferase alpha-alpha toroid [Aspergillus californicus]
MEDTTRSLQSDVQLSLKKATQYAFETVRDDGHWCAETETNPSCTAEYVLFLHIMGLEKRIDGDRDALISWLLSEQQEAGSWSLARGFEGDISMTTEAYLALKLLGLSPDHPAMLRARQFALSVGGVARVRMLTRIYLAMVGLFPWKAVPELPSELILAPASSPINIYRLSSWSRAMTVPLLIVRHHEPIYALPNGASPSNNYLDELWLEPAMKHVSYMPQDRSLARLCFLAADYSLHLFGSIIRRSPIRTSARRQCVRWILDHQDDEGGWAGMYPCTAQSVMALRLEGFDISSDEVQGGLAALEGLAWRDTRGLRIQASVSPIWDTALMTVGLCDAGVPRQSPYLVNAMQWVMKRQILKTYGHWRVYRPSVLPGGFSFQYSNRFCPDLDDTAAVMLAILKQDPRAVSSRCVIRAAEFLLGLQSTNGGWGAYEADNDSLFMNKLPFSDMDCLSDPATADVTGRVVEAFGLILASRATTTEDIPAAFLDRVRAAVKAATTFLSACQEPTGAWYGRWGVNYVFGTSSVLCGLGHLQADGDERIPEMASRATQWLKSVQNSDGGWGESLLSYRDSRSGTRTDAGVGPSTASQTAWGLMGLLAVLPATDPAITRGIQYLVGTQSTQGQSKGASWDEHLFTGVGFPNWFYMKYNFYQHYFPLMALGRWATAMGSCSIGNE